MIWVRNSDVDKSVLMCERINCQFFFSFILYSMCKSSPVKAFFLSISTFTPNMYIIADCPKAWCCSHCSSQAFICHVCCQSCLWPHEEYLARDSRWPFCVNGSVFWWLIQYPRRGDVLLPRHHQRPKVDHC